MRSVIPAQMPSVEMKLVMIERARLGCRVDGGGSSRATETPTLWRMRWHSYPRLAVVGQWR